MVPRRAAPLALALVLLTVASTAAQEYDCTAPDMAGIWQCFCIDTGGASTLTRCHDGVAPHTPGTDGDASIDLM